MRRCPPARRRSSRALRRSAGTAWAAIPTPAPAIRSSLNPGQNALLVVRLDITQAQAKAEGLQAPEYREITYAPGGSDQNTNPGDDSAIGHGQHPGRYLRSAGRKDQPEDHEASAIVLQDRRQQDPLRVPRQGPEHRPRRLQRQHQVHRPGAARHDGDLLEREVRRLPGRAADLHLHDDCACVLNPAQNVLVVVRVDMPVNVAKQMGCKVRNRAHITYAPVGNKNTDAADEHASVLASVPADICDRPQSCQPEGHQGGQSADVHEGGPGLGVRLRHHA